MVSRVHKRIAMYRNLQLLRSIRYSNSRLKASVLLELSDYIQGLKQKLEELNQLLTVATARKIADYDPMPKLEVETQEEAFVIKVLSESSCQGLLVFILEAFEEMGLDVLQARVSCADSFSLEAIGNNKENNEDTHTLDAQLVEQVVSQAIQNWWEVSQI
ncbi:hypothetical protein AAZX31_11G187800 [Glycine max]|uniref:Plant bHLH transcription factor ACT-like domain-containing protein n=1 Tax=Glycine max TaxID=3847 RepID=K7LR16_SOYBN|nr:uncharacterized protein LOC100527278 [Glycine max]KAG4989213.1 hypothetical protein JHK85_032196 [Glycine max]KAG4994803.1 hypothetical protein JHK86_031630 [Glycine max]KAG5124806.1 hypothetical protein JHK82_031543 [Glycine max]KAH1159699.1 hypothetical protein GYH30_031429 [Glycine max]KAH1225700.1 hypothetical protein GmHk_11G032536 [Glycine max]|eukprot:NP_001237436.2 uncharacterized protein LOC100527278 [Glycine max]